MLRLPVDRALVRHAAPSKSSTPDERTQLARERTYSAWLRTGLTALGGGLATRALVGRDMPDWLLDLSGTVLVLLSAVLFTAAARCARSGVSSVAGNRVHRLLSPVALLLVLLSAAALYGIWR